MATTSRLEHSSASGCSPFLGDLGRETDAWCPNTDPEHQSPSENAEKTSGAGEGADGSVEDLRPPTTRDPLVQRPTLALTAQITPELLVDPRSPFRVPPHLRCSTIERLQIPISEIVTTTRTGEIERATGVADERGRAPIGRPIQRRRSSGIGDRHEHTERRGEHQLLEPLDVTGRCRCERCDHQLNDGDHESDERRHETPSKRERGNRAQCVRRGSSRGDLRAKMRSCHRD